MAPLVAALAGIEYVLKASRAHTGAARIMHALQNRSPPAFFMPPILPRQEEDGRAVRAEVPIANPAGRADLT